MQNSLIITWFGRCCFLAQFEGKSVLFDPYDGYCGVDIGIIPSDILLVSSSWHDHGHIGASPKSYIYSYEGISENSGFKICGIKAEENRGTPTIIYNITLGPFSVTNFADFGPKRIRGFDSKLTTKQKDILRSTNIAFIRPSIVGELDDEHIHNEVALKYCRPSIIFPEHYFPVSFTEKYIPDDKKEKFLKPVREVDEMIELSEHPLKEINSYFVEIQQKDLKEKNIFKFRDLHPQVRFCGE